MKLSSFKRFLLSELFLSICFLIFISIPNFFQRFFEVDEGVYAAVSKAIFSGKLLYVDVWDHKPPLIYLFYSPVALLNVEIGMLIIRFIALLIAVIDLYFVNKILVKLNLRKRFRFVLLIVTSILLASPLFEGNFINAEILFLPVILIFIYRILNNKLGFIEGLLMFLAFFIKFQAFAEIAFLLFVVFTIYIKNKKKLFISNLFKLVAGFLVPISISAIIFAVSGNLKEAYFAIITMNFGYVDQYNYLVNIFGSDISRKLILLLTFLLLFGVLYFKYLFLNRKSKLNNNVFFLINVFLIEAFLVLYPERNYGHYLQQFIPGIILSLVFLVKIFTNKNIDLKQILVPIGYTFFLFVFLLTFTTAGIKPKIEVTGFPLIAYYTSFMHNTSDPLLRPYFNKLNNAEVAAKYFYDNYSQYKTFYMYTKDSWIFTLCDLNFNNKYFLYSQMYFTPEMFELEKGNILSSEVIFKEDKLQIQKKLNQQIEENFKFIENYLGYSVFVRKDLL